MHYPSAATLDKVFQTLYEKLGESLPGSCAGGLAKFEDALNEHGLGKHNVPALLGEAIAAGGHCDCEVLLNAAERMLSARCPVYDATQPRCFD